MTNQISTEHENHNAQTTPGVFITFEGGEGAGKTSTVQAVSERLQALGYKVLVTREPGGLPTGEAIRAILLGEHGDKLETISQVLLFTAARAEHLEKKVKPALEEGYIVLGDRYYDSTFVYQGLVGGYDLDVIKSVTSLVAAKYIPTKTYILDLDSEIALERLSTRNGEITWLDLQPIEYHRQLREGYLELATYPENQSRVTVVDANRDLATIADDIVERILQIIR